MYAKLEINPNQIKKRLGLDEEGRVQKVIDLTTTHYLRLLMPEDSGTMERNTKIIEPGIIQVQTPYAHYQNVGIKYVMPHNGKSAYHNPITGMFWSDKGKKKIPSSDSLNYNNGINRGAHFVERTITEHKKDILKAARNEVKK